MLVPRREADTILPSMDLLPLLPFIFLGALLYTSVGHGGATVYLAVFTLFGLATAPLVTVVLVLNIVAASIAWLAFRQAGYLRWKLLAPLVVVSVPMAYVGGLAPIAGRQQAVLLGVALLFGGLRLLLVSGTPSSGVRFGASTSYGIALVVGAVLGFLAGATGIGGGIFLSPVLIALRWATVQEAASVASAFIVLNSVAGLAAKLPSTPLQFDAVSQLIVIVVIGALAGSYLGARRLPTQYVQRSLGLVLLVASAKSLLL